MRVFGTDKIKFLVPQFYRCRTCVHAAAIERGNVDIILSLGNVVKLEDAGTM